MRYRAILVWSMLAFSVLGAVLLAAVRFAPPVPKRMRIGNCYERTNVLQFSIPEGSRFNLVIGGTLPTTWAGRGLSNLDGNVLTLRLSSNSKLVYERNLTQRNTKETGLLRHAGVPIAYSLTERGSDQPRLFEDYVEPHQTCEVVIVYQGEPPESASLWLTWLGQPALRQKATQ